MNPYSVYRLNTILLNWWTSSSQMKIIRIWFVHFDIQNSSAASLSSAKQQSCGQPWCNTISYSFIYDILVCRDVILLLIVWHKSDTCNLFSANVQGYRVTWYRTLANADLHVFIGIPYIRIHVNVDVNVYVYSLIYLEFIRLHNLHPGIGTLSYTVSSPLGRIQHIFCS